MNYETTCSHFLIKFKYISSATPKRTTIEVPTSLQGMTKYRREVVLYFAASNV